MQIVINHLTRMRTQSRICIAGLDRQTFVHIRPVTPATDLITRSLLRENGGPVSIGAIVDIGTPRPQPTPPETEDHVFRTANARLVEQLGPDEYWELLQGVRVDTVDEAFGSELEARGRGYAIEKGKGSMMPRRLPVAASTHCLRLTRFSAAA